MKNVLLCFILLMVATALGTQSGLGGITRLAGNRNIAATDQTGKGKDSYHQQVNHFSFMYL